MEKEGNNHLLDLIDNLLNYHCGEQLGSEGSQVSHPEANVEQGKEGVDELKGDELQCDVEIVLFFSSMILFDCQFSCNFHVDLVENYDYY